MSILEETALCTPYLIINNQGQTIQFNLDSETHILGRHPINADLKVNPDWDMVSRIQATLYKEGDDYRIYDGDGKTPSTNRIFVNHSLISLTDGFLLTDGAKLQISQNLNRSVEIKYFNPSYPQPTNRPTITSILIQNKPVVIGRETSADLVLESPIISRQHAIIQNNIIFDKSKNGIFINDTRVKNQAILKENDKIRIGPYILIFRNHKLEILDQGTHIRLDAENLFLKTNNKIRIDKLSFSIEPGSLVALVGGSGAGKSTLMRTLLGIEKLTSGTVYINGYDIQQKFNLYRNQIGYVPQDDIIHQELTVNEVVTYAAKLRLSEDINLKEVVHNALKAVEMTQFQNSRITKLSGGQRKRVSIAVELLADPKLFFLDEPTSGLDPGLDKKMMQLLQKLAHDGNRTIILVTHATANITNCDRIVFLGRGGKLCYFGTPQDALQFFQVHDFADIYNLLEQESDIKHYAEEFATSDYYNKYITNQTDLSSTNNQTERPHQKKISFWQQLPLLTQRCSQLILRDRSYLLLSLSTAPIAIFLVSMAAKDKNLFLLSNSDPSSGTIALRVLFIFTCAALWVGFSNSLQEIVKESAIYLRERLVNLGLFAYLGSKVITLSFLAIVQAILILVVILMGFESPNIPNPLISWNLGLWINSFLTLLASFSLGMLISAVVKNSSQANGALPLLILPQTIFAGVLFKTDGFFSKILSWFTISRWSVGGYGTILDINSLIPKPMQLPDGTQPSPIIDPTVYEKTWSNLNLNWGFLLLHAIIYLLLTLWVQKRKDILK